MKAKKLLSAFLAGVMMLSTVSFTAFAEEKTISSQTITEPFKIDEKSDSLTYEKCTIEISNADTAISVASMVEGFTLTFKDSTVMLTKNKWSLNNPQGTPYNLVLDNTTLTIDGTGSGTAINLANITMKNGAKLVIKNVSIGVNTGSMNLEDGSNVEIDQITNHGITNIKLNATNSTINVSNCQKFGLNLADGSSFNGTEVNVQNCATSTDEKYGYVTGVAIGTKGNIVADSTSAILVNGKPNYGSTVAKVGDTYYETFNQAAQEAKSGETITLIEDVDMSNSNWNSINLKYPLILDGNGKTITGLDAPLFSRVSASATIKNLTIKNSNIGTAAAGTGEATSAALIGWCEIHTSTDVVNIENVIVTDSKITADTGFAGGLVAWANVPELNIKNCSVTNCEITAESSVGGVIGHECGNVTIENVIVGNNKITSTDSEIRADKAGAVIGRNNGGKSYVSATETAVSTMTPAGVNTKRVIGTVVGGAVEITGGSYFADPTLVEAKGGSTPVFSEKHGVVQTPDNKFTVQITDGPVKIGTTQYLTIQSAIDAAEKGDVVTLIKDTNETGIKVAADKQITLDLNNKTLTGDILSEGILTVKNGTINSETFTSAIESKGENASLKTHKVNITSQRHALRIEGGSAEILSGTYQTVGRAGQTETVHALNAGGNYATTVVIKDGEFRGLKYDNNAETPDSSAAVAAQKNATVTIEKGTFVGGQNNTLYTSGDGKIIVNGGSYDQDPTAYLNPDVDGLKIGKVAYAEIYNVINDTRKIVPVADKDTVEADEIVKIEVKVHGDNLTTAYWELTYDTKLFECITNGVQDNGGKIIGTKTLTDNTTDVFKNEETLATYQFKAIAQDAPKTNVFETSKVRVYTAAEGNDGYQFESDGGKAEVAIKLTDYKTIIEIDGKKVTGDAKEVPYTGNEHIFTVTPVPGLSEGAVTYLITKDGKEAELKEKGTYTITYTIPAQTGFAECNGTFTLTIGSPEYVVEVNTGKGYFADYVLGKKLVLVYTNTPDVAFEYNGHYMIDVSKKGYLYNDRDQYDYVFAIVVEAIEGADSVEDYTTGSLKDVKKTDTVESLVKFDMDINSDKDLHLTDIKSIYDTYNVDNDDLFNKDSYGNKLVYARCMNIILKSDVDGDKTVTGDDTEMVVTAIYDVINGMN